MSPRPVEVCFELACGTAAALDEVIVELFSACLQK